MLARASAQAGDGAGMLFARLETTASRSEHGAEMLSRLASRLRAGVWNDQLADLIMQAETIEKSLGEG